MKKKTSIALLILVLVSSVASAAPLLDYADGKTQIELTNYPSLKYRVTNQVGYNESPSGRSNNLELGITVGLGNRFAVQYRIFNPRTEGYTYLGNSEEVKVDNQEFNVLYKLNNNVAGFIGYHRSELIDRYADIDYPSFKKNTLQYGLTGATAIGDKWIISGIAGIGKNLKNYEAGLAYNATPELSFQIKYRVYEGDRFHIVDSSGEYFVKTKISGLGYGITYTF